MGGALCIPFLPLPASAGAVDDARQQQRMPTAPPPSRHVVAELQFQWYSIVGIKLASDDEAGTAEVPPPARDAQAGTTGPNTRIVLTLPAAGSRRNARLPDYDSALQAAVDDLCIYNSTLVASRIAPPRLPQRYLHEYYDRHCQRLLPCLRPSIRRLGHAGGYPVLVHSPSQDDAREALLECAKRLGLLLVVINARNLLGGLPDVTASPPPQQWCHPCVLAASQAQSTAAFLVSCAPCLVLIEEVDQCIYELVAASRAGGDRQPEDPTLRLTANMAALMEDVSGQMLVQHRLAQKWGGEQGPNGPHHVDDAAAAADDCLALFAAHTGDASQLGAPLRGIFPCDCHLEPLGVDDVAREVTAWWDGKLAEETSALSAGLRPRGSNASTSAGDVAEVARQLGKEVKALGGSVEAMRLLLHGAALAATQRVSGDGWLDMSELYEVIYPGAGLYGDRVAGGADGAGGGAVGETSSEMALTKEDVKSAAQAAAAVIANRNGAVPAGAANISPVRWADIGGLDRVRKEILDILQLPLLRPDLFPPGCPMRRAVLLYGPPGTGKTLVARAVATECDMAFLSVKGPELLDIYVGESERNVRKVFENARCLAPCVLFFDELDSLAPARGRGGDAGGVMDRVVSQLLTEMDSLAVAGSVTGVFVMGATNRPDLLDTALLRPGRFDRKVYLSVCKDASMRLQILQALTRTIRLAGDVNLLEVAEGMPARITGADIGAVTSAAYGAARERKLQDLQREAVAVLEGAESWPSSSLSPPLSAVSSSSTHPSDPSPSADHNPNPNPNPNLNSRANIWAISAYVNALPPDRLEICVTRADLQQAVREVHLSVSEAELVKYEALGRQFDNTA